MLKSSLIILLFVLFNLAYCTSAFAGKIAIIIDDIGNSYHDQAFTALPKGVGFAILPFTPYAKKIAYAAHQQQRELLLHIPMAAKTHNHLLGEGALTPHMSKLEYEHTLIKALADVPHITGANNHMGSELTEHPLPMKWTMELLFQQGLFFLDSRTTGNSLAESSAVVAGLPAFRRHVFLDNIRTAEAMEVQFKKAIKHSEQSDYSIIIAHPYPETLRFLSQRLKQADQGYRLVTLTELMPEKARIALQHKKLEYQQKELLSSTQ